VAASSRLLQNFGRCAERRTNYDLAAAARLSFFTRGRSSWRNRFLNRPGPFADKTPLWACSRGRGGPACNKNGLQAKLTRSWARRPAARPCSSCRVAAPGRWFEKSGAAGRPARQSSELGAVGGTDPFCSRLRQKEQISCFRWKDDGARSGTCPVMGHGALADRTLLDLAGPRGRRVAFVTQGPAGAKNIPGTNSLPMPGGREKKRRR